MKFDVLTLKDMKKLNMGALIGVGQGSVHEPKLLVIEYRGAHKNQQPIAIAGKGITFDTGGISLKKNAGMWAMKSDMAGAAAAADTLYVAAMLGEKVNLVGLKYASGRCNQGMCYPPCKVLLLKLYLLTQKAVWY